MLYRFLLCCYFLEMYIIHAMTVKEVNEWFIRLGFECNAEHPIPPEDIKLLMQYKYPPNSNSQCLIACVYQKARMMNSKGMFDLESTNAIIEKNHADNPKILDDFKKITNPCTKVNDEAVTDGEKGCERAVLLFKCFMQNAAQMGIKLL